MLSVSVLDPDGHHAHFDPERERAQSAVSIDKGTLVVHVRDGDGSLRLRIGEPLLSEIRRILNEV